MEKSKNIKNKGKLYILPTPIGDIFDVFFQPFYSEIIQKSKHFVVENIKSGRRFVARNGGEVDKVQWFEIGKKSADHQTHLIIETLKKGENIVLTSDCGCPSIADPGKNLILEAHEHHIEVVPLPGSSSISMALMSSGLQGQFFSFHGYLPIQPAPLKQKLLELDKNIRNSGYTQIFIETPHRNIKLFQNIVELVHPQILLCVATAIHCPEEYIKTLPISQWKKQTPKEELHRKPTVFLLGK